MYHIFKKSLHENQISNILVWAGALVENDEWFLTQILKFMNSLLSTF